MHAPTNCSTMHSNCSNPCYYTPVWLYNTSERKLSQIERPAYEQASAELTNLKQTNSNLR